MLERIAKEKDPAEAWALKEQEAIAKQEKDNLKRREKVLKEERTLVRKKFTDSKARIGFINYRISEANLTIRDRFEPSLGEMGMIGERTTDAFNNILEVTTVGAGMGAAVGAGIYTLAAIFSEIDEALDNRLSKEEKAEIKSAIGTLTQVLAEQEIDTDFEVQFLALADQLQAGELLTKSSTPFELQIEIQEIGLFKIPTDPHEWRLWLAANARLVDTKLKEEPTEQRTCYGSLDDNTLVSWSENDGEKLKDGLLHGYRYIANEIFSGLVGLAPDPAIYFSWDKTDLACIDSRKVVKDVPSNLGDH